MAVTWNRLAFISDDAYGAGWNGVAGIAPSQNAVYDEMELRAKAAATITDNQLVRGDGGSRGVQESTIIVDDSGRMINPSQPAFLAYVNTQQNNVTGDGTTYDVTGAFWTEVFDQGNNFSNGIFTAPITGRYQLSGVIFTDGITAAMTSGNVAIETSNRYYLYSINPYGVAYGGAGNALMMSFLCDLDINDTAKIQISFSGGTKVVDVRITYTYIAGVLIC